MQNHCLKYKDYKMRCQVFGNGAKTMLAFHGFGRDGDDFKVLEPSLGRAYRIISFDLFYHGKSDSPMNVEAINLSIEDLKVMINGFLLENNIERFSLLAYSLGGRISLELI